MSGSPKNVETESENRPLSASQTTFQNSWFGSIPVSFMICAVVFYVAGLSYISGYYSAFGLSLRDLSFEINEIMVLAQRGVPWWFLPIIVPLCSLWLIVLWSVARIQHRSAKRMQGGGKILIIVNSASSLISLLLPISRPPEAMDKNGSILGIRQHNLPVWPRIVIYLGILAVLSAYSIRNGRADAAEAIGERTTTLPQAEFEIKPDSHLLTSDGNIIHGYLLAHGRSGYYILPRVLKQDNDKYPNLPRNIEVDLIPEAAVVTARITTGIRMESR